MAFGFPTGFRRGHATASSRERTSLHAPSPKRRSRRSGGWPLYVDDRAYVDAVVDAKRASQRIDVPVTVRIVTADGILLRHHVKPLALLVELVGPQRTAADAVPMPAPERATATRPFVILARPLLVEPGALVEHGRAHCADRRTAFLEAANEELAVDDGREAEARCTRRRCPGPGSVPAAHMRARDCERLPEWAIRKAVRSMGDIGAIAQIQPIRPRIQRQGAYPNARRVLGMASPLRSS
jgi:hypothetical protein